MRRSSASSSSIPNLAIAWHGLAAAKKPPMVITSENLEAPPGFEPGNKGFAGLCLTAWLRRQKEGSPVPWTGPPLFKAGNRTRTGDPHLGKVVLYQLSYSRGVMGSKLDIRPGTVNGDKRRGTPYLGSA